MPHQISLYFISRRKKRNPNISWLPSRSRYCAYDFPILTSLKMLKCCHTLRHHQASFLALSHPTPFTGKSTDHSLSLTGGFWFQQLWKRFTQEWGRTKPHHMTISRSSAQTWELTILGNRWKGHPRIAPTFWVSFSLHKTMTPMGWTSPPFRTFWGSE